MSPPIKMVEVSPTVFNVNVAHRAIVTAGAFSVITIFVMNGFLKIFFEKKRRNKLNEKSYRFTNAGIEINFFGSGLDWVSHTTG